jgi:hypothetical protein
MSVPCFFGAGREKNSAFFGACGPPKSLLLFDHQYSVNALPVPGWVLMRLTESGNAQNHALCSGPASRKNLVE